MHKESVINTLTQAGIEREDAITLRRISMTLHRWHELKCGEGNDYSSYCIVRGHKANGSFTYDDNGKPYIEQHFHQGDARACYSSVMDRERGAQKRLAAILKRYPGFTAYVQTDPRGAALYILRPGDLREGEDASSVYNRGIAVYK